MDAAAATRRRRGNCLLRQYGVPPEPLGRGLLPPGRLAACCGSDGRGSCGGWLAKNPEAPCTNSQTAIPESNSRGAVDDAVAELARCRTAVVPLLAGSGTRLKILEAWAAGLPVVSTRIGAEGLGARPASIS